LPAGFGVLVTRPAEQAEPLCSLIEQAGGQAIQLPLLEIEAVNADSSGAQRLSDLAGVDWLIFISANAVRYAFTLRGPDWLKDCAAKIAAIGQATARVLADNGVTVDLKPKQQFNSETLLAEPKFADVKGRKFLIVRGIGGREKLAETLRERGGFVEYAEVYRRVASQPDMTAVLAAWHSGRIGAVTLTSGEALDNLLRLLAGGSESLLTHTPVVVIGERLAQRARAAGCVQVIAAEAGDTDIFNAVARVGRALIDNHQP
jgi:uroporphyrinogen-III synthase